MNGHERDETIKVGDQVEIKVPGHMHTSTYTVINTRWLGLPDVVQVKDSKTGNLLLVTRDEIVPTLIGRKVEQLGDPAEGLVRGEIVGILDVNVPGDHGQYVVEWEDGRRSRPLAHKVRVLPR